MKKYIRHILIFFAIIVIIDVCFGKAFDYMVSHVKNGKIREINSVLMKDKYDIIILGSSRATHHYIPQMIEDSLGITCFNAGADGNGIVLMYGRYKMITNRYNPKVILYDVEPSFDIMEYSEDDYNRRYLAGLKPYFYENGIRNIFTDVCWSEGVKNFSGLFRYNGEYFNILRNYVKEMPTTEKGYIPLNGVIENVPDRFNDNDMKIDSLKITYIRSIAEDAKSRGIIFIFTASPKFGANSETIQVVKDIALQSKVQFWDYTECKCFQRFDYFRERMHLNNTGAVVYNKEIISRLKPILTEN